MTSPHPPSELGSLTPSAAPQPKSSLLGVGGPVFNIFLVMTLMTISFVAVALPDRNETTAVELADTATPTSPEPTPAAEATTTDTEQRDREDQPQPNEAAAPQPADDRGANTSPAEPEPEEAAPQAESSVLAAIDIRTQDDIVAPSAPAQAAPTVEQIERIVYLSLIHI